MKIGVFDSGIGGLFVSRELEKEYPNDQIIFRADTEHMPYGNKEKNLIIECANHMIDILMRENVDIIIVACGTVSSLISYLNHPVPIIGVIEPLCNEAYNITKNKKIGVIATVSTIESCSFPKCLSKIDQNVQTYTYGCPTLASLIEKHASNNEIVPILHKALLYLVEKNVDTIILGCTHYSWVLSIAKKMFPCINFVDSSKIISSLFLNFNKIVK